MTTIKDWERVSFNGKTEITELVLTYYNGLVRLYKEKKNKKN